MTQAISHFSRHDDADSEISENTGKKRYIGSDAKNAEKKIRSFYRFSFWTLIALATVIFLATHSSNNVTGKNIPSSEIKKLESVDSPNEKK